MSDAAGTDAVGSTRSRIDSLFLPQSVAVIGASRTGVGRQVVENFRRAGYTGGVSCVNPKYEDISGFPCVGDLRELDVDPDVAVIAVGRDRVLPVMDQVIEKHVRGAVVFAIGFAERDELGRQLQERLVAEARSAGLAVVGPNCQGLINFTDRVPLYMDAVHPYAPGKVALICQSGSVATALINNRRGVRWSHVVSSGNEAMTDAADFLQYFVDSPAAEVVCLCLETIRRPADFFQQCDRAQSAGKALIAYISGRTHEGARAVVAHSGALALPHRLATSALRRHGVVPVESLEELLETAKALQAPAPPGGGRLGVVTASGGQVQLVHDNLPGTGLSVPMLSDGTREALSILVGPSVVAENPLDWWGMVDHERRRPGVLELLAGDPQIDIVLEVGDFTVHPTGGAPRALEVVAAARDVRDRHGKVFVVLDAIGGAPAASDVEAARDDGILVLSGCGPGLRALGHLARKAVPPAPPRAARTLPRLPAAWGRVEVGVEAGDRALDLVEAAGFDVVSRRVADTMDEAVAAAEAIGFPVAVKAADSSTAHKTRQGLVLLALSSADQVRTAVGKLFALGARTLLVEEYLRGGVEMLLGVHFREPLGSFLLIGLGGVWTELLDDVQIRPAHLRMGEAAAMVAGLRCYAGLQQWTSSAAREALGLALERLDDLALQAGPALRSVDINPLVVLEDRAVAVDALVVKGSEPEP